MKRFILLLLTGFVFSACVEILNPENEDADGASQKVPDYFDYVTTRDFQVSLKVQDNGGKPLSGIPLSYGYKTETGFVHMGMLQTNAQGEAMVANRLPDYIDSLYLRTEYLGLPSETGMVVLSGSNHLLIGGASPVVKGSASGRTEGNFRTENSKFTFLSSFDAQGVPANLEPVNDYIPQDLLDLVNNSLPERRPVPQYNPEYIADNINADTRFQEMADVWITFVHEGAGWKNTLGYYTYDLKNPPATVSEITNHHIIFPNVSLSGSGGNLKSGNKIYLGRFPANTGIGWFLIPDAWNGTSVVDKPQIKYSNKGLNTFTTTGHRAHVATLKDDARELFLLGIEDTTRPGGDNDFNDAVFFITANPYRAIIKEDVASTKAVTGTDSDRDNVLDRNDLYPNDPDRAFHVFAPAENVFGSLAFEDMWPAKGDYDMNDVVVDYNFKAITNVANEVTELQGSFRVRALGASFQNGLGIELPISPDRILSAETDKSRHGSLSLNANGTEAGQDKAVIILFENSHELFGKSGMVNTQVNQGTMPSVPISLTIKFSTPIKLTDLGYAPFNAFIFVNKRSMEVHLPGMPPTSQADWSLLGTQADSSRPLDGRYYKSGDNLPWAISLPVPFDYPVESQPINKAHLKFNDWSKSGGALSKDWYKNSTGHRSVELIYK